MHTLLLLAASLVGQYHPGNCVQQLNYTQQAHGQGYGYGYGYGYGQGYANFGQNYVYNQQQQVLVDPAYYAQATAAHIRAKAAADVQALADREIAKRLDKIEARVTAPPTPSPYGSGEAPGVLPPGSAPEPGKIVRNPPPPLLAAPPKAAALVSVLEKNKCAACHTGESSSKGFRIFEDDGTLAALDIKAKQKIHARTDPSKPKSMPPKGDRVGPADRKVIADSIRSDLATAREAVDAAEKSIEE